MSEEENISPPLLLPKKGYVGESSFEGDKLDRKEVADHLTSYLERLRSGAVIAIDAPWGEGKTWFGRNWEKSLQEGGYKVAFIDAFEQDYIEDPFLLVAAELTGLLQEEVDSSELIEQAVGVMKALVPVTTKALINFAGRAVTGSADVTDQVEGAINNVVSASGDLSEQWIRNRLEGYTQEKETLQHFKESVGNLAANEEKPIIIIIDELDRCKPTFSVALIERLKHFFDVPNLVFVLLMNKTQLERSVAGVYGREIDSQSYLGKFINLVFRLPKKVELDSHMNDDIKKYCEHVFRQYKFGQDDHHRAFVDTFSMMATLQNLSLRDIEKGISWYAFSHPNQAATYLLSYVIILKLIRPELVTGILAGSKEAHQEGRKIVKEMIDKAGSEHRASRYLGDIDLLHGVALGESHNTDELQGIKQSLARYMLDIERLLVFLSHKTELSP